MTVLQALDRYYDRLVYRASAVPSGYVEQQIGYALVIDSEGRIVQVNRLGSLTSRKAAQVLVVPAPITVPKARTSGSIVPYFLWDKSSYLLGVRKPPKPGEKEETKIEEKFAASRKLHLELLAEVIDPSLVAVRSFFERYEAGVPEDLIPLDCRDRPYVFSLDGSREYAHATQEARNIWAEREPREDWATGVCLVRGTFGPIERLHPKITGFKDADTLVSFNEDAFKSYGKDKGANAPASRAATHGYTSALNSLLGPGSRQRIQIGDATVVFWADASGVGETVANAAESFFAMMIEAPDDESEAAKVSDALKLVAKGRPVQEASPEIAPGVRFHVLGLAPNAARLSIRFWLEDTFERFAAQLARHHEDLALQPRPLGWTEAKPPSVQRLLVKTTALQEKFDKIPPLLAGEVMRAVLTGAPYPRTLLTAAIVRLRAGDDPRSGWHAAIIKACLNRFANTEKEKLPVALDPNRQDTAYQLGRLFAVLESAQYAALGRVNAPIGDRYYAAASSMPARVFGTLLRGLKNHVADARKRGRGGWIEPKVAEIVANLPPELPRTLKLEDQGRFAIGYYHERATRPAKANEAETGDQDK